MTGITARTSWDAGASRATRRIEDPLFLHAERPPARPALVDGDTVVSYGELACFALELSGQLRRSGIETGDRVAIYLDKTPASVASLYGVWAAGGVTVPVHEGLRSRQLQHIVEHSGARFLLSQPRKLSRIESSAIAGATVIEVSESPRPGAGSFADHPGNLGGGVEPAAILYTSGSTGRPKGILLSHENLLAGARIVSRYLEIQEDERILSVLPFGFDYGLNQLLTAIGRGATLVLLRSSFPGDIQAALVRHAITALAGVPPLWFHLLGAEGHLTQARAPKLRYITNSGGVFPTELVERCRERLPDTRLYLMYGLTEAFRSTYLPPEEIDRRPGSIGRAIPETDIHVLDEGGRECAPGQPGELVHAGPTVALGYWRDPEATAATFRPLPHRTEERVVFSGDLVTRDEEGFLYFVGRRDQLIKCQGFRVSPDDVEETLYASGLLAEVAVQGIPDPLSGQAIVAHVVPRDPHGFSEEALLRFCRREMPAYMVPRAVRVRDSLPRTPSGKIDRKGAAS